MLSEKAKKLVEEMNELKAQMSKQIFGLIDIEYIDEEEIENLKLMKKCYELMNDSMEYMVEQAEVMDQMNLKLDLILECHKS